MARASQTGPAMKNRLFENVKSKRKRTRTLKIQVPAVTAADAQTIGNRLGWNKRQRKRQGDTQDDPNIDNFLPAPFDEDNDHTADGPDLFESPLHPAHYQLYARAFRRARYAEQREKFKEKWAELTLPMTVNYLESQRTTRNWTTQDSYLTTPLLCLCAPKERTVDLIDLLGRHSQHTVAFCDCQPDPVRLVHLGYLASSPITPQTAFSIRLIEFHHEMWQTTALSTKGFIDGVMGYLDQRSSRPLIGHSGTNLHLNRDLREQFTHSVDVFRRIMLEEEKLQSTLLELDSASSWADRCPRCFGPSRDEKKERDEPDVIIAMDGNFQQRHYQHASKDTPEDHEYPPTFLVPSDTKPHEAAVLRSEQQGQGMKSVCSESHTAANDKRTAAAWKGNDNTGLFASTCRHDIPLRFVNLYKSAEKLYNPIALLDKIVGDHPGKRFGVLYDIGCHLDAHIKKRGLLPDLANRLRFGTSVFHAYVHEWACQVNYHPRFNKYWALSDGEGLERLWSFLAPLVASLRTSTRLHRLQSLYWRSEFYARGLNKQAGSWLKRKLKNAKETLAQAEAGLQQIHHQVNKFATTPDTHYTNEFLQEQWILEKATQGSKSQIEEDKRLELGRLLCLQQELDTIWASAAPSAEQALVRLSTTNDLTRRIAKQQQKVGDEAVIGILNNSEKEALLQVWFSKSDLRRKFLAVCRERFPLQMSQNQGRGSNLGVTGLTAVLKSVRNRAAHLFKAVEQYNNQVTKFTCNYPDRTFYPPSIQYAALFKMAPDDPFWNDGLFTNGQDAWAVDPITQQGMRQLAYAERSHEEIRRLGWEVRRLMRWAVQLHSQLYEKILVLRNPDSWSTSEWFNRTSRESNMSSIPMKQRWTLLMTVVHQKYVYVLHLQGRWHLDVMSVLQETSSQSQIELDSQLKTVWLQQVVKIQELTAQGCLSMIPGDFTYRWGEDFREEVFPARELDFDIQYAEREEVELEEEEVDDMMEEDESFAEVELAELAHVLNQTGLGDEDID